jgi:drug/metabolite transporter (DMT)-like permease
MRPVLLGILSALFFAVTFVLNRKMDLGGGSWVWSASLRYLFMTPMMLAIVIGRRNLGQVVDALKQKPGPWLLWSTIGFGLFYAPLCFAAAYSPGWLVAGTWQVTIISGSLLAPLFGYRIPLKGLALSAIILLGIVLLQMEQAQSLPVADLLLGVGPILVASFAYPLGNRKMMAHTDGQLDVFQRVLGMTLASLPFWLLLSGVGLLTAGLPSSEQVAQSVVVAASSGVIATALFFRATDMVRADATRLAAVEATQSAEVLFALFGEMLLLAAPVPSAMSWAGIVVIVAGMLLHSLHQGRRQRRRNAP